VGVRDGLAAVIPSGGPRPRRWDGGAHNPRGVAEVVVSGELLIGALVGPASSWRCLLSSTVALCALARTGVGVPPSSVSGSGLTGWPWRPRGLRRGHRWARGGTSRCPSEGDRLCWGTHDDGLSLRDMAGGAESLSRVDLCGWRSEPTARPDGRGAFSAPSGGQADRRTPVSARRHNPSERRRTESRTRRRRWGQTGRCVHRQWARKASP